MPGLGRTRMRDLSEADTELLRALTGMGAAALRRHADESPLLPVAEALAAHWPPEGSALAPLRVSVARAYDLAEEIARVTRVSASVVRARLRGAAATQASLQSVFPELRDAPSPRGPAPLGPGTLVGGRWLVGRALGAGTFGETFEVRDTLFGSPRLYVMKLARGVTGRERLRIEYELAQGLGHEHICTYKTMDEDPGVGLFAVLGHGGRSLLQLLQASGPWRPAQASTVCGQVARGLDFAHAQGILHLDVKPANILLDEDGRVRIGDWGASVPGRASRRSRGGASTLVGTSGAGHTPSYAAPEQLAGAPRKASDQFGLARVFCALVHGGDLLLPTDAPLPLAGLGPGVNAVLSRACAPDPESRFTSCGAFARALTDSLS